MDFTYYYDKYQKISLSCVIPSKYHISQIVRGSGGSNNIVVVAIDKNGEYFVFKIIPQFNYPLLKVQPNQAQLEIKFHQFFTKKYILTERTPHIVGIYHHKNCKHIDKLLKSLQSDCPSYETRLIKKISQSDADYHICHLQLENKLGIVKSEYDIIMVEYCPASLDEMIKWHMKKMRSATPKMISTICTNLASKIKRVLFQLIFTLAIIKDDYPGFLHGDFFMRNILISYESEYNETDYVAYHYRGRIYYLEANGIYAKINDFGQSIITDVIVSSTHKFDTAMYIMNHRNPYNKKSDIFNILHDIYDGQNLGATSIYRWMTELDIKSSSIRPLLAMISQFIDTKTIDAINNNNNFLLNGTWDIDGLKILENTVQTPRQYLLGTIFSEYMTKSPKHNIVRIFNQ